MYIDIDPRSHFTPRLSAVSGDRYDVLNFSGDDTVVSSRPGRSPEGKSAADQCTRSETAERISKSQSASHVDKLPRMNR